jgi:phage terminase large subunit GpA-like protein
MDFLSFREQERGHFMRWPDGKPREAFFVCRKAGCVIEHQQKRDMVAAGEWRSEEPFRGHASFHIWAAYSFSPNATWGQLAEEFVEAKKGGPEKLKTFVNTVLGETWVEKGEAPDWQRIYLRRERYPIAMVPVKALLLTAGVDVQRDRLVWEVVAWGDDKASWSIDAGVIPGDTSKEGPDGPWPKLDELLDRAWLGPEETEYRIRLLAIDSGFNTQMVYNWARGRPMNRVIACKGVSTAKTLIGSPSAVDVTVRGKKMARGYKVWPVGIDIAKSELYGWLRLDPPTAESGDPPPPGYCHFPEHGEDYFKQLTAEHLVSTVNRRGFRVYEWQVMVGRENHFLDCRVYARAAAALAGLDRHAAGRRLADSAQRRAAPPGPPPAPMAAPAAPVQAPPESSPPPARRVAPARAGWLGGGGRGWLGRR